MLDIFNNLKSRDINVANKAKKKIIIICVVIIFVIVYVSIKLYFQDSTTNKKAESHKEDGLKTSKIYDEKENFKANYIAQVVPEVELLKKQMGEQFKENEELKKRLEKIEKTSIVNDSRYQDTINEVKQHTQDGLPQQNQYSSYPTPYQQEAQSPNDNGTNNGFNLQQKTVSIISNSLKLDTIKKKSDEDEQNIRDVLYLPTGTIIQTKLISGLNAPTLSNAKSNPLPVLLKITDFAFLPNKYRTDIKECSITGEAYGYLSTERANVRINNISCVVNDRTFIDNQIAGYVAGEDGKLGMKGVAVSKQGALLGRAFIASFIEGLSKMFSNQGQTIISTGYGYQQSYDRDNKEKMESALASGLGGSAKTMTDFYKDLLQNLEPTIEISAGRDVDVILTAGAQLKEKTFTEEVKKDEKK